MNQCCEVDFVLLVSLSVPNLLGLVVLANSVCHAPVTYIFSLDFHIQDHLDRYTA